MKRKADIGKLQLQAKNTKDCRELQKLGGEPCQYQDLGLLAFRTVREEMSERINV